MTVCEPLTERTKRICEPGGSKRALLSLRGRLKSSHVVFKGLANCHPSSAELIAMPSTSPSASVAAAATRGPMSATTTGGPFSAAFGRTTGSVPGRITGGSFTSVTAVVNCAVLSENALVPPRTDTSRYAGELVVDALPLV